MFENILFHLRAGRENCDKNLQWYIIHSCGSNAQEINYNHILLDWRLLLEKPLEIDRPIFIVGCQRSGTTIFYRLLSSHPDLAWFSNFTDRFPGFPHLAVFSNLFPLRQNKFILMPMRVMIPKPREGVRIFGKCISVNKKYLSANDVLPEDATRLINQITAHLKYHGRPRFLNKNITNAHRIGYLNAIFPEAIFLHMIRDPRANVASILNWDIPISGYPSWAWKPVGNRWLSLMAKSHSSKEIRELIGIATKRWVDAHEAVLEQRGLIKGRYIIVNYEELVSDTRGVMSEVIDHCELEWSDTYQEVVSRFKLTNMNDKYSPQFMKEDIEFIEEMTKGMVNRIG